MALLKAAALLAAALLLAGCSSDEPEGALRADPTTPPTAPPSAAPTRAPRARPFSAARVDLGLEPVFQDLSDPLLVTHAGDGSGLVYVVEQTGRVLVGPPDGTLSVFLDVTDRTRPGGEQGLLGLAFHPDYENNGRFFINYTDTIGDTIIAEYERSSETEADPESARILMKIFQPYPNHNGGNLAFGPDGFLYIGMGDGGSAGDPDDNAQNPSSLLGKMLRIDVDGTSEGNPYGIPSDNERDEIWADGLRNPWRFSFDRQTGDLWIADVGQNRFEEINHVPAGTSSGLNFGWDVVEARTCHEPVTGCDPTGFEPPVAFYSHDFGCSVTGGHVYRGRRFEDMIGGYFFGDYCSGLIWALDSAHPQEEMATLLETEASIASFGEDENGELYLCDQSTGTVFRLVDKS